MRNGTTSQRPHKHDKRIIAFWCVTLADVPSRLELAANSYIAACWASFVSLWSTVSIYRITCIPLIQESTRLHFRSLYRFEPPPAWGEVLRRHSAAKPFITPHAQYIKSERPSHNFVLKTCLFFDRGHDIRPLIISVLSMLEALYISFWTRSENGQSYHYTYILQRNQSLNK